ncbi:hypothetical protein IPM65_03895 [Candidatus Roizmanbacteria bacterium]|nr:MAG: hypothetical protein IPM65_03895 [Candidatus Roizmanbacteria bacterium]
MKLNTKTIIQTLPLDDKLKQDILSKWDTMDQDLRYEIENLVWEAYYEFEDLKVDENILKNFEKAKQGEIPLNGDFYDTAVKGTEESKTQELHQSADSVELAAVREKLEQLMQSSPQ